MVSQCIDKYDKNNSSYSGFISNNNREGSISGDEIKEEGIQIIF